MKQKWYEENSGIVFLLIVFFPVGLYLMWKHATWRKGMKIGITALFAFFFLMGKFQVVQKLNRLLIILHQPQQ